MQRVSAVVLVMTSSILGCASPPRFRIVDSASGEPVPNTRITVLPSPGVYIPRMPKSRKYTTDEDGMVTLDRLPTGDESRVYVEGYEPEGGDPFFTPSVATMVKNGATTMYPVESSDTQEYSAVRTLSIKHVLRE